MVHLPADGGLMRLWRISRSDQTALDGAGAELYGARYSAPGRPLVHFASEPGLAVLVAFRYLPTERDQWPSDAVLGWTDIDAEPERIPPAEDEDEIRQWVGEWLDSNRSLLAAIPSRVLPVADIVMMNPAHDLAANVPPLTVRRFDFAECLHRPPMLGRYNKSADSEEN